MAHKRRVGMSALTEPCSVCLLLNLSNSRICSGVSSNCGMARTLVKVVCDCSEARNVCALKKVQTPLVRMAASARKMRIEPAGVFHDTVTFCMRVVDSS